MSDNRFAAGSKPALAVDYDLYAHHLENAAMTEEEKRQFLDALWAIICEFVVMGYGVHPVQEVLSACGQARKKHSKPDYDIQDCVHSDQDFHKNQFETAAQTAERGQS
ncbi:MAG: hypothetical protein ACPGOY_12405 [Rhodospirillaceae bacterium]